ncbi:hypothetical protein [Paraburkholderia sp. BCC1884]|uniref:hypothetical protein n=1 Tax=Paraburkholderia sp. BCC1884 TaxID=2562668 RepID=UPI0021B3F11C|nr:hypothetical protein [Paraburkholderia sp. BCC1884]
MIAGLIFAGVFMLDLLGRVSWSFFNIGVPVFAPIALLPLLSFSRFYRQASAGAAMRSVQDGQLLWGVISMCASACYEIGCGLSEASHDGARALMLTGLLWHVLLIIAASILVSFGAADSATLYTRPFDEKDSDRRLLWPSLFMTAISAASFSASHYSLT